MGRASDGSTTKDPWLGFRMTLLKDGAQQRARPGSINSTAEPATIKRCVFLIFHAAAAEKEREDIIQRRRARS